jgi:hypothetical protein
MIRGRGTSEYRLGTFVQLYSTWCTIFLREIHLSVVLHGFSRINYNFSRVVLGMDHKNQEHATYYNTDGRVD